MSNFVPTKSHLREALILYFNQKKTAAESHRLLMETYPDHCPTERTCQMWFKKFHEGDFNVEDKQRENRPKKFTDEALEALLDEDQCQTPTEIAAALNVTQASISKRLYSLGMIQKSGC